MNKETSRALASITLTQAVKEHGKHNVDRLVLSETLESDLPGLTSDAHDEILDLAEKLIPYVEVHVDVAYWRLDDVLNEAEPEKVGAVW
ncbi:hypothetical protein SEA_ZEIGLE_48 [Streptomyces phage Zeigle]|nr:hypothetical protein SEA_ZEIGLE_48 [Streptomyces phage Zeigle]WNA15456.1 hypothetical protein SEA_KUMQUAT_48 [Streptomyces phage Kumquat]